VEHDARHDGSKSLHDQVGVLRRRKWILLLVTIAVPVAAIAYSLSQETLYKASASVILSRQNPATSLSGVPDVVSTEDPERFIDTQVTIARSIELAREVIAAANLPQTPLEFRRHSSVATTTNADVMDFSFTAPTAAEASRIATAYATGFTDYRHRLDTEALNRARADVSDQIALLRREGREGTAVFDSLLEKDQQLQILAALTISNAKVVHAAGEAQQVQPRPLRNGVLALLVGILLGVAIAFLREALDNRIRSAEEIARLLGMPLIARLPEPPRRLRRVDSLVALAEPRSPQAEAFRMLQTNLEFATIDHDVRSIMVTSAQEQEGKSTTAANLAVMLARRGRRVTLVDLDLRRPYLHKFFGLEIQPGITDVALGRFRIEQVLHPITVVPAGEQQLAKPLRARRNGNSEFHGFLEVVTAGAIPPDPGDFAGSAVLGALLRELRERSDFLIVDSPPLLPVGDAMTLSPNVDAIVLLTRMNRLRRSRINEVRRILGASPAMKLGFVVTDAGSEDGYAYYGNGRYYGHAQDAAAQHPEETRNPAV
jgi:tyrosine-protein kinase